MNAIIDFILYSSLLGGLVLSAAFLALIGGGELNGITICIGGLLLWYPFSVGLFVVQIYTVRLLYRIYAFLIKHDFG